MAAKRKAGRRKTFVLTLDQWEDALLLQNQPFDVVAEGLSIPIKDKPHFKREFKAIMFKVDNGITPVDMLLNKACIARALGSKHPDNRTHYGEEGWTDHTITKHLPPEPRVLEFMHGIRHPVKEHAYNPGGVPVETSEQIINSLNALISGRPDPEPEHVPDSDPEPDHVH